MADEECKECAKLTVKLGTAEARMAAAEEASAKLLDDNADLGKQVDALTTVLNRAAGKGIAPSKTEVDDAAAGKEGEGEISFARRFWLGF